MMSIAAFALLLTVGTSPAAPLAPEPLATALSSAAGATGRSCGLVAYGQPIRPAIRCAEHALLAKQPFFIALQFRHVDSDFWEAAALSNKGKLEHFYYDSNPHGQPGDTAVLSHKACRKLWFNPVSVMHIQCAPAREP